MLARVVLVVGACSHAILAAAKENDNESYIVKPWDTMVGWMLQLGEEDMVEPSEAQVVTRVRKKEQMNTLPTSKKVCFY